MRLQVPAEDAETAIALLDEPPADDLSFKDEKA
jgi:hypothetical protein